MKVLFLTHPEADFGEYFLYNGLCELLGPENVIDVPYKKSYHGECHNYSGYSSYNLNLDWGLCGTGPTGCTCPFSFSVSRTGKDYGKEELINLLHDNIFDIVFIGSPRIESIRYFRMLRPFIKTNKIVIHDGEDYETIMEENGVNLYLKRELTQSHLNGHSCIIKPFPFSSYRTINSECDKTIDVLCAVGDSHPIRGAVKDIISSMSINAMVGYWGGSRYYELLCSSKIAVAPRGFGKDTVRRWEIPSCKTLLMCEKLDLIEDNPLVDGVHCVYWYNLDDLRNKLLWWLSHDEERIRISEQGYQFVSSYHTNKARASKSLEWVREVYG